MKNTSTLWDMRNLLCTTGGIALVFCSVAAIHGQQPVLVAASTRLAMHRVGAAQLEPGAPEPPQNNAPQLKDDLFAGTEKFAKNATEANEVNMDPDALNLVGGPDSNRAHRTLLNTVHHYEYDKPGMYNPADVDEFRRKLEGGDWHCSVHSRDLKSGESTDICSRRRAPDMIEQAIITVEPKELTFIHTIRRANGQGGSIDGGGMPGMSMIPGLPFDVSMAAFGPEIEAVMLAATAELQAGMPALQQELAELQLKRPDLQLLARNMRNLKLELSAEQRKQLNAAQRSLRLMLKPPPAPQVPSVPSAPSAPSTPPAPTAPEAPTVPSAPTAPGVPSVPAVPEVPATPSTPSAPSAPTDPTVPATPSVPSVPAAPTTPSVPPALSAPSVPSAPHI